MMTRIREIQSSTRVKFALFRCTYDEIFSSCCYSVAVPRQRPWHCDQVPAKNNERRRGHWPRQHDQIPATHAPPRAAAWAPRPKTCAAPRATAGRNEQIPTTNNGRIGLGTTIKYLRGAAGNGLDATIKYLRGAAGISLGTTAKYLRRKTSGAAGSGLGTIIKYLVNQYAGAGNNRAKAHYTKAGNEFN
jgi:hypothetical protein